MGFNFLVSVIAIVFLAWNSTNHKSAQSEIVCRSLFSSLAARSGRSTMMYRLVSSAKRRMEQPMFLTISFMYSGDSAFLVHGNAYETLINDLETQRLDHA